MEWKGVITEMYDVDRAFGYIQMSEGAEAASVALTDKYKELATLLLALVPRSREAALALTNLEQSWQWSESALCNLSGSVVVR